MLYCVLVKISRHQLSFWYQIEGEEFAPLSIKESNKIPMVFYVNGNEFNVGLFAKERANVNDPNSYSDYFSLIKNPTNFFMLHGDSKPIKQLLYYGIENYLSHFIKTILYKNESIESYRIDFCLRFCFEEDIESQERKFILKLFSEAGYENVAETNTDLQLNSFLSEKYRSHFGRIILSCISNNLFVNLYSQDSFEEISKTKIENQGSDPRAKIIANLILEDISDANPHININSDVELVYILNHCVSLLYRLTPLMRNNIELSNGALVDYKIRLKDLNERLLFNRGVEDKVIPHIEDILKAGPVTSNKVDIILIGDEINTGFFKERLNKNFPNVYNVDSYSSFEKKLIKRIFKEIIANNYRVVSKIVSIPPKVNAPPKFNDSPVLNPPSEVSKPQKVLTPPRIIEKNSGSFEKSTPKRPPPPLPMKVDGNKTLETNANSNSKPPPPPPIRVKGNKSAEAKRISKPKPPPPPPPPPPLMSRKKK